MKVELFNNTGISEKRENTAVTQVIAPRMRTLDEAYAELLKIDADTSLSKYSLRKLVLSGKIPCIEIGHRRLINFDALLLYLSGGNVQQQPKINGIRPVKEVF